MVRNNRGRWIPISYGCVADSFLGYEAFVVKMTDYNTQGSPLSWSKPMAMRHAISKFPDAAYLWFLDQHALILDPSKSLEERFLAPKKLEGMMKKDFPVVPPDSIIKTFSHLRGEDADIIVSQDKDGLVSDSLVVRNGDWGKFFVETWFAPLYRSYNFQRAEKHALVCDDMSSASRYGLY